jgi:hypothetical protein
MAGTRKTPESDVETTEAEPEEPGPTADEALGSDHPYAQALEQGYYGEKHEPQDDLTFESAVANASKDE